MKVKLKIKYNISHHPQQHTIAVIILTDLIHPSTVFPDLSNNSQLRSKKNTT